MKPLGCFVNILACVVLVNASCASAAEFPVVYNSETDTNAAPPSPEESLAKLRLPPGFKATVFAAEPDVQNPIAMAWDGRGPAVGRGELHLRRARDAVRSRTCATAILIFEDTDGDGRFDTRKVFTDDVQMLTSVEVGLGGVWVMCPPQLLFIPDADGDDMPDGAPEVVLDGFTVPPSNYHNFANGLRLGPGRLALRPLRRVGPGRGRRAGHARRRARFPCAAASGAITRTRKVVRGAHRRHHEPLGPRLGRARRAVLHQHGQRPPLARHPRRCTIVRLHTIDPNPHVYELIDSTPTTGTATPRKGWTDSRDGSGERTTAAATRTSA